MYELSELIEKYEKSDLQELEIFSLIEKLLKNKVYIEKQLKFRQALINSCAKEMSYPHGRIKQLNRLLIDKFSEKP